MVVLVHIGDIDAGKEAGQAAVIEPLQHTVTMRRTTIQRAGTMRR